MNPNSFEITAVLILAIFIGGAIGTMLRSREKSLSEKFADKKKDLKVEAMLASLVLFGAAVVFFANHVLKGIK